METTSIQSVVDVAWEDVSGVQVLRADGNQYLGVPCSGRKDSRRFDIIDIDDSEYLCQLSREETYLWLCTMARDAIKDGEREDCLRYL